MTKKKFIRRTCIRITLLIIAVCAISIFVSSIMPTIGNDVAIGQLENDDSAYAFMSLWNNLSKFMDVCKLALTGCCIVAVGIDAIDYFKYMKDINNENI